MRKKYIDEKGKPYWPHSWQFFFPCLLFKNNYKVNEQMDAVK